MAGNPHAPASLAWEVINPTGQVVWSIEGTHTPGSWWPTLHPDICQLAVGLDTWDLQDTEDPNNIPIGTDYDSGWMEGDGPAPGSEPARCSTPHRRSFLKALTFYVCPKDDRSRQRIRQCGGPESLYCAAWGCETTGTAYWVTRSKSDWLTVHRNSTKRECTASALCNGLNISFTEIGRMSNKLNHWYKGRTWGLRFYASGYDFGLWFTVRLQKRTTLVLVGPNLAIRPVQPSRSHQSVRIRATPPPVTTTPENASQAQSSKAPALTEPSGRFPLFNLISGAYAALNTTQDGLTQSCWLCLSAAPPYYEGIAVNGTYNLTNHSSACNWGSTHQLTLPEVSGRGLCLGNPPPSHQQLCARAVPINSINKYLASDAGTWWACDTGLTPCVSTAIFNNSHHFCVMVRLFPRVLYHGADSFEDRAEGQVTRFRREPLSLTLAVLLGARTAVGIGVRTTALIQGTSQLQQLQAAIDQDLKELETSITALKNSLTSLSEVVLQNKRGLDLLFMQEGGLCVALREECCFYADHTGVVEESMTKLRQRLAERQREREAQRGWFESWFTQSPWLTTLVSAVAGPLIILLLILTIGPCVLNKLIRFIQQKIGDIKLLIIRQQYTALTESDGL